MPNKIQVKWLLLAYLVFPNISIAETAMDSQKAKANPRYGIDLTPAVPIIRFAEPPEGTRKPLESTDENAEFVDLAPPPIYVYKRGTVSRSKKENTRYIAFEGATLTTPYFDNRDDFSKLKGKWQLTDKSYGYWVWSYEVNCNEMTFNRLKDKVGWREVAWDTTAQMAMIRFCPIEAWEKLPYASGAAE
jgi:hypothetical protein